MSSADYPSDGTESGNCDLSALLSSRIINRGAVDLFSNKLPDAKNIERLDYIYEYGVLSPFVESDLELAGHAVAEKSGNNPIKVAAILSLDVLGQPAEYGPLVLVEEHFCLDGQVCYGLTDLHHTYSFLQNSFNEPHNFPVETERSLETIGMAYLTMTDLGLAAGQRYYGISFFADDVESGVHDLLDPGTFPNDTADTNVTPGDDADIYGGLSGYFLEDAVTVATGSVFNDTNGDGIHNNNEAGISDIAITVYTDENGNGLIDEGIDLPLGDYIDSDMQGNFVLPGIPNGNYLVLLDSNDPEIPPGLVPAPGTNPYPLVVASSDIDGVSFPFVNSNGSTIDDGNNDSGSVDSGTADSGTADSGTADSGTADSGTDDGSADSGNPGNGNADAGNGDGGAGPIGDGATAALDDVFEINQGSTGLLDVLNNDVDGTGAGLTLISVSDSPNAVVTIVDNQISYQPVYGYFSNGVPDTFLYVMEDADGTRQTGNVTVDVIRFSDLNGNSLNDFVECGCSNLVLITGIHGAGVGRMSILGSLVLFLTFGLRRRAKRKQLSGVALAKELQ